MSKAEAVWEVLKMTLVASVGHFERVEGRELFWDPSCLCSLLFVSEELQ